MYAHAFYCINALAAVISTLPIAAAAPAFPRSLTFPRSTNVTGCRYLPGDAGWPSEEEWSSLNDTVGGRLIRGTPLAQSCYGSSLDPAACTALQDDYVKVTP